MFSRRRDDRFSQIETHLYPRGDTIFITLDTTNNFTIGGEIYTLPMNPNVKITRATSDTDDKYITNILLKCIDDTQKLGFSVVADDERYIDNTPKHSARSYATLVINKTMDLNEQKDLVERMNAYIHEQREKYHSLFLPNYRDSNRKRISFDLAFRICGHLIQ